MTTDLQDLEKLMDEVNDSIEEIRNRKIEVRDEDLPSNFKLLLTGVSDSRAVDFLFSHNVDKMLDKLFDLVASGDIEKILNNEEKMKDIFKDLGFGEGSFEGPVSKAVLKNIKTSVDSVKFAKIKSNMRKALLVMKNLERQSKYFRDPEQRKKYDEAVYAVKQIMKFAAKLYKNRKIITSKVFSGLNNIVSEEVQNEEALEKLF
jgi:hypothetical protein